MGSASVGFGCGCSQSMDMDRLFIQRVQPCEKHALLVQQELRALGEAMKKAIEKDVEKS